MGTPPRHFGHGEADIVATEYKQESLPTLIGLPADVRYRRRKDGG